MPSRSIESCARESDTVPLSAFGQMKPAALQALGKQAKTVTIKPETLDDVASSAAEDEDMARKRLLLQYGLHLRTEAVKAAAHIRHARGDPDPGSCRKLDHLPKLSRIERTRTGSAPLSTVIVARPASSM
jgi:hypothetical protein